MQNYNPLIIADKLNKGQVLRKEVMSGQGGEDPGSTRICPPPSLPPTLPKYKPSLKSFCGFFLSCG